MTVKQFIKSVTWYSDKLDNYTIDELENLIDNEIGDYRDTH